MIERLKKYRVTTVALIVLGALGCSLQEDVPRVVFVDPPPEVSQAFEDFFAAHLPQIQTAVENSGYHFGWDDDLLAIEDAVEYRHPSATLAESEAGMFEVGVVVSAHEHWGGGAMDFRCARTFSFASFGVPRTMDGI